MAAGNIQVGNYLRGLPLGLRPGRNFQDNVQPVQRSSGLFGLPAGPIRPRPQAQPDASTTARGGGQGKLPLVAYNEPTGQPRYGSWAASNVPPPSNAPPQSMIPMGLGSVSQFGPMPYGLSQTGAQGAKPGGGFTHTINEPNTMNQLPMGLAAGIPQGGFGNTVQPPGRRNKLQLPYGKAY